MGIRSENPKPWKEGVDMPPYSGKTWKELQDIYPPNLRIKDDAWRLMGLFAPAWLLTKMQYREILNGGKLDTTDLAFLCWMQRVEEAHQNVGFRAWPVMKGINVSGNIFSIRKAKLTKLGLVESMPVKHVRLYRVTGMGKSLIKSFTDNLNQANENLKLWVDSQTEEHKERMTRAMDKSMPGWNEGL